MKKENLFVILTGVVIGIAALVLTALGNPANMGFCIACFERDIAGAVGLHSAAKVQYVRPEIIGLVLGSFLMAIATKEWKAKAGSSPALRFVLGAFVMIGALAFLGCPLRMVLRLAGGDLNAVVGLAGFAAGIFLGTIFIRKGFTLQRNYTTKTLDGTVLPAVMTGLLILFIAVPTLFKLSEEGPGSKHAPFFIALVIALVVGALAQKSRMCMVGGLRDTMMFKDMHLLWGFIAIFVTVLIGNLIGGSFNGFSIPFLNENPMLIFILAPGGFFVFGMVMALANKIAESKGKPKAVLHGCENCPMAKSCSIRDTHESCEEKKEAEA